MHESERKPKEGFIYIPAVSWMLGGPGLAVQVGVAPVIDRPWEGWGPWPREAHTPGVIACVSWAFCAEPEWGARQLGSLLVFCAFLLGKTRWPLPAVLSLGVICLWHSSAPALVVPVFQKLSDSWPCPLVFSTRAWGSLGPLWGLLLAVPPSSEFCHRLVDSLHLEHLATAPAQTGGETRHFPHQS